MDILIKSFNRPFYLDRCINSIYSNIQGNYSIKILDDGTPEKYLNKIQNKYPEVKIIKSKSYLEKNNAIKENLTSGKEINGFKIPTNLWIEEVKKSSPIFIITEDDVWFTRIINVNKLEEIIQHKNIFLLKLGWLGSSNYKNTSIQKEINFNVIATTPKIFTAPNFIMEALFMNKFKCFSLLYRLGIVNHNTIGKYWILNSILMGMYKKEYWLKIWENSNGKVNEKKQLLNAIQVYRKNIRNINFIAQLNKEAMKTTFISSATNSYHKGNNNFDVNQFNHIINEKWYHDEFDSLENFPNDFSDDYIISFLKKENNPKASPLEWEKWANIFKEQYRNQGCIVD